MAKEEGGWGGGTLRPWLWAWQPRPAGETKAGAGNRPDREGILFIKIKSFIPEQLGWVGLGEAVAAKEHHCADNE